MTLSLVTLVTSPGKWLRADSAKGTDDGLAARFAANRASAAPSTRRRPPGVRAAGSCPPSIQRLTVSELTPSNSAAWPTVNVGTAPDSIWHLPVSARDSRADEAKIGRQPRGCVSSYVDAATGFSTSLSQTVGRRAPAGCCRDRGTRGLR